ncbi:hypothetical protein BTM25_24540 [Actinomadura rubteroloni]|uniref:Uncharacterized protein n=1 Tax=Actinomadura rubteroloni TaxID=1926885 RepID=A0A2P4UFP0_9ACTN|nr:hypothetical protein [Actinomadura rubteroloni]POM23828.1 hypothetical protein BTM25_24540 [Actinomadura rubteroloni]
MAISDRIVRYLGSAKNLFGCVGGLAGLGLHFTGVAGPYSPAVVAGLYAAGALLAPPEKVTLVLDDTVGETERLRADLEGLVGRVRARRATPEALERLDGIAGMLRDLLSRPDVLGADPLYEISRAIRTDLPMSFETYLDLPRWYALRRTGHRTASEELLNQLDLIAASVTRTADDVYAAEAQRLRDHTDYLRGRERDGDLTLPDPPAEP